MANNLLYRKTNENLKEIFNHYDIKDKSVLTVLASSDQLFSCIYNESKQVDTFDINSYTLYYYYLRKWLITYKNTLYPDYNFFEDGNIDIYELICSISTNSTEEQIAKLFWKDYLKNNNYSAKSLFEDEYVIGDIPYKDNLDIIKDSFKKPLSFKLLDFKEPVDIDKKYDVLILSNMLEYESVRDNLRIVKENIEKLLNINGIVILSYKILNKNSILHQNEIEEITKDKLILDKEYEYYEPLYGSNKGLAYSYKKIKD